MNDILPVVLAWAAAAVALYLYWDGKRRWQRANRKPTPIKTDQPQAAVIEIVERGRATTETASGSVIIPNDVRINGQSLLVPRDSPVIVHEIKTDPDEVLTVTLTLFARRVTIAAEGDLT
ncbi:hypothetical protein [Streptomyces swartbergensis]|uniref:hypothetical protein n=1 Tax=Streptomyces swartbergensis TaxID=487165 RepID=UPI00117E7F6E|nr:hypothetical protein [Streptomyces swartbergensis]